MTDGILRFRDRLYVFLLGAAIAVLAWIWRFESVPPDLMDALAAAAGLGAAREERSHHQQSEEQSKELF